MIISKPRDDSSPPTMNAAPGTRLGLLPNFLRAWVRQAHVVKYRPHKAYTMPEGHGEKIWVFVHRRSEQVIYSFQAKINAFHGLKALPFNGKKSKPAKIRKDYWSPMAMIHFPPGMGAVGRSVFQRLRELKHLHEVAWPEEFLLKQPSELTSADKRRISNSKAQNREFWPLRTKKERGKALNAQKKNAIADMAAVLAGEGAGNKMVDEQNQGDNSRTLVPVTVNWSNDQDKHYAEAWTSNVAHGLFDEPSYVLGKPIQEPGRESRHELPQPAKAKDAQLEVD